MSFSKQNLIVTLLIGGCIIIILLGLSGNNIANHLGWGWNNKFPDHVYYHGRSYSLGISGCKTRADIENIAPSITQIGTMPMLFSSSYPQFAPENQVKSNSRVMLIFAEENSTCYRTYSLEGGP